MKMEEWDKWLDGFEKTLYDAASRVRKIRVRKPPICTGCRYRLMTYAYEKCKVCEPTGTMFESAEEGGDDERRP